VEIVLIALLIVGGVSVYVVRERIVSRPRRQREEALRAVAGRLGLTYERDRDPFAHEPRLDQRLRRALPQLERAFYGYPHMLRGDSRAGPVAIFDVWFGGAGSGDATDPYKLTLAAFQFEDVDLPQFSLTAEGLLKKAGDAIFAFYTETIGRSQRDLDFGQHPDFSERYTLQSADEGAGRALFGPELIAFWEGLDPEERWAAAGAGKSLAVYREPPWSAGREQAIPAEEIADFVRGAEAIAVEVRSHARVALQG
jgi:hypothetical protein